MSSTRKKSTLLVDAGNTRLKWLYLTAAGINTDEVPLNLSAEHQYAEVYTADETPQQGALRILQKLLVQYSPERIVFVHVLGQELMQAVSTLSQQKQCELTHVSAQGSVYGIKSAYANPEHLGADRLVALVAARFFAKNCPAVIIDCGTAVTVDAVDEDGQHLGGVILPGLNLLSDVLIRRTQARHMAASVFEHPTVFADNTIQAIGSGCLYTLVGAIEGICQRMQQKMSEKPVNIICGGDAAQVHALFSDKGNFRLEPAALMTGLWVIAGQS